MFTEGEMVLNVLACFFPDSPASAALAAAFGFLISLFLQCIPQAEAKKALGY